MKETIKTRIVIWKGKVNMKIKAKLTINVGLYEDIRPEVEIDTENIEESKAVIKALHNHFHGMFYPDSEKKD